MVIKNSFPHKYIYPLVIILLAFVNNGKVFAQTNADSSKHILLASLDVKKTPRYIVKEGNVVFPDILKGNEAFSCDYIAAFSSSRKEYLVRMHTKGKAFLPKVNIILKKYDLPEELGVLMILESACNANAVSKAGAVGYWQIMDEVAKEYGLKYVEQMSVEQKKKLLRLNSKKAKAKFRAMAKRKDERKNFDKSTVVAARYLKARQVNLDKNWLLVVASYNCGVGNVWHAMEKSGKTNPNFWDIKKLLPAETQVYVMNFIALNVIFHNYENFIKNNLSFAPVEILIPDNFANHNDEKLNDIEN